MISKGFLLRIILALVILAALLYKLGPKQMMQALSSADLLWIFPIILLWGILFFLGAYNLNIFLKAFNIHIPMSKLFRYNLLSWSSGLLLPGKIGEIVLIKFLKKENIEYGQSSVIYIVDKLITLIFLMMISIFGAVLLFDINYLIIALTIFSSLLLFFIVAIMSTKIRSLIKRFILRKYSTIFSGFSLNLFKFLKYKKSVILFNLIITIFKAIVSSIAVSFLFLSLGQQVNFLYILIIDSMITIITLISITPNGLGIKESSAAFLYYSLIGIDPVIAASASILGTIITNIIAFTSFLVVRLDF